ncbi:MCE family protein [Gordonia sp. X0973]|uniref:MlaD family protein n=1 Tax=Gordonia sp. X0973 TaxID=2742602 RepID=UPI000F54C365|nr:MlaD family protein [Gordonia sp. X0973]QKT08357.1 MCE family protein [Gordonia sp. X0973]
MTSAKRALVYLIIFAVVAIGGGIFVANGIVRPVPGASNEYTGDFTNVAGLRVGNDVRRLGTRVGKVTGVELYRPKDQDTTIARVKFTLARGENVYTDSHLAIRYLNLTGVRYLDLQQKERQGAPLREGSEIGVGSTTPSFDITQVFHGLAPVFQVMKPDDVNRLSEGLVALVEGDGSGFGKTLDSLTQVVGLVDQQNQVIDTLVDNLKSLSATVKGNSQYLDPFITYVQRFGNVLVAKQGELRNYADSTGAAIAALDDLVAAIGFDKNDSPGFNDLVRQVLPLGQSVVDILALTPGILAAVNSVLPPAGTPAAQRCSKGQAQVPANLKVFLRGTQVTLCQR